MRKKSSYLILLCCAVLFLFNTCGIQTNFVLISVPLENKTGLKLEKFSNLFLNEFKIDNTKGNKDLIFQSFINDYFLNELPATLNKNVTALPKGELPKDSLIINGNLTLKVLKSNIIRKVKRIRTFVSIENWSLEMKIVLNSPDGEKPLFEKTYKSTLKEVEADDPIYNFKTVFYRCCDEFTKDIYRKEKIEQRYLLFK